jgi:two-component system NarL family response regulator
MTICIVEDNFTILENLRLLLDGEPDMEVSGCYETAEDALRKVQWDQVDVLLVDLELPGMPGIELIQRVRARSRDTRIIAHTIYDDRATVLGAIRAGACGYVVKGCRPSQLITALHEIYEGGAPMSPVIARTVLFEFQNLAREQSNSAIHNNILTLRERTILQYLEQGLTYKAIALRLSIASSTVHTHIKNIYGKLHARNKIDAIRKGRYNNLI